MSTQVPLKLEPSSPYSLKYFIPHSGVAGAVGEFERVIADYREGAFQFLYLFGPPGVGKTHLVEGGSERARELGINNCAFFEFTDSVDESRVGEFVAKYEELRRTGGLFFTSAQRAPSRDIDESSCRKSPSRGSRFGASLPDGDRASPDFIVTSRASES